MLSLYLAFSTGRVPGIAASKYATCNQKNAFFLEQAKSGTNLEINMELNL
jgi:hypothetical protein